MDKSAKKIFKNVDEYINSLPKRNKEIIKNIRKLIKKTAPEAEEVISYQMPAFKYHGMLVYYAAFKDHYSLFPMTDSIKKFKEKLKSYKIGKGTIQFDYDKPLPVNLIKEIVKYRVQKNLEKKLMKDSLKKQ